jgi:NADP-dependent 3-hydroxy acid dehydrogenase YdfG
LKKSRSLQHSELSYENPWPCANHHRLLEEVDSLLKRGVIRPCLSIKTFEVSELDQALLYFSKGTHVGKLVIDYDNEASNVPIVDAPPTVRLDRDAVYVLVGGLGGLGRSIVRWMVGKGARNLAVCNRSGNPPPEALVMIEELTQQGVFVRVLKCDVANKKEVDTAICAAADVGPVKGILHAAVVLQDRVFSTLTHSQWEQGLYAKVHGTINLHEAANDMKLPLEFFIMTSSFEAVMALPTQAAYCAANCFQDAFARYRNSLGLPGCAIAFGLITEIGEMGQREKTRKMIYRNGLYRTGELGFLRLLEGAFLKSPQPTSDLFQFDPLAKAQITTCLEPAELAKMAGKHYDTETQLPRWHSDRKFSHLLQSMNDHLSAGETRTTPKEAIIPAITSDVDTAIRERSLQDATDIVTAAIIERTASLLFVPLQSIEASKSVAHYGVDSLIAVELRNWFTMLFQDTVPLLKLLDESVSIRELGAMVAEKRSIIIKLQ